MSSAPTLVSFKNALFSHFLTESIFDVKEDVAALQIDDKELADAGLAPHKAAILRAALEDLARNGVISEIAAPNSGLFILNQPLNTFSQTVPIHPMTAEMIGDAINWFGEATVKDPKDRHVANKLAISDTDLTILAQICHTLLNDMFDEFDEGSPSSGPQNG